MPSPFKSQYLNPNIYSNDNNSYNMISSDIESNNSPKITNPADLENLGRPELQALKTTTSSKESFSPQSSTLSFFSPSTGIRRSGTRQALRKGASSVLESLASGKDRVVENLEETSKFVRKKTKNLTVKLEEEANPYSERLILNDEMQINAEEGFIPDAEVEEAERIFMGQSSMMGNKSNSADNGLFIKGHDSKLSKKKPSSLEKIFDTIGLSPCELRQKEKTSKIRANMRESEERDFRDKILDPDGYLYLPEDFKVQIENADKTYSNAHLLGRNRGDSFSTNDLYKIYSHHDTPERAPLKRPGTYAYGENYKRSKYSDRKSGSTPLYKTETTGTNSSSMRLGWYSRKHGNKKNTNSSKDSSSKKTHDARYSESRPSYGTIRSTSSSHTLKKHSSYSARFNGESDVETDSQFSKSKRMFWCMICMVAMILIIPLSLLLFLSCEGTGGSNLGCCGRCVQKHYSRDTHRESKFNESMRKDLNNAQGGGKNVGEASRRCKDPHHCEVPTAPLSSYTPFGKG